MYMYLLVKRVMRVAGEDPRRAGLGGAERFSGAVGQ
jgi:hypothetical protein